MPLVSETLDGNAGDPPMYLPVWRRMVKVIGHTDWLFVGDSKLHSAQNIAEIHRAGGYVLTPLQMTLERPVEEYPEGISVDAVDHVAFEAVRRTYEFSLQRGFEQGKAIPRSGEFSILYLQKLSVRRRHQRDGNGVEGASEHPTSMTSMPMSGAIDSLSIKVRHPYS
jgi:hypothetical protein